jgi:3-oxoacyl-[acyl-carrier-protein] synthase II
MKRRVVVTGLGVVTALGRSVEIFWDRLLRGDSGVGPITLFDVAAFRVQFAGEVPWNPEVENIASTKEVRRLDRFTQFAMAAAADVLAAAKEASSGDDTGITEEASSGEEIRGG